MNNFSIIMIGFWTIRHVRFSTISRNANNLQIYFGNYWLLRVIRVPVLCVNLKFLWHMVPEISRIIKYKKKYSVWTILNYQKKKTINSVIELITPNNFLLLENASIIFVIIPYFRNIHHTQIIYYDYLVIIRSGKSW